jgi:two-component system KDP operon response regulator KdpE
VHESHDGQGSDLLGAGDLIIDVRRHCVWVRQREVLLTQTEFELFVYMWRNRGQVLTHTLLTEAIWGQEPCDGRGRLKQLIGSLRRKIEVNPRLPQWLVSRYGVGYILLIT